jgi:hypothetical protein
MADGDRAGGIDAVVADRQLVSVQRLVGAAL